MTSRRGAITTWVAVLAAASPSYATEYLTIEQAQQISFPTAKSFQSAHIIFNDDQKKLIEERSGVSVTTRAQKVWKVYDKDDNFLGWFVVDYVIGKHLLIDYSVAINKDRSVHNVEILSYRESYGGEIRSHSWLEQFEGKTKDAPILLNHDINNISGATLSSRHVTEGVKRILATIDVTQ